MHGTVGTTYNHKNRFVCGLTLFSPPENAALHSNVFVDMYVGMCISLFVRH